MILSSDEPLGAVDCNDKTFFFLPNIGWSLRLRDLGFI